ncbi:MAG: hypothetical protein ACK5JD_17995 [Mangrovibacterium sp.]
MEKIRIKLITGIAGWLIGLFVFVSTAHRAQAAGERKFTAAEDQFLKELTRELDGKVKRNENGKRDIYVGKYLPQSIVQLSLTVLDAEHEELEVEKDWFLLEEGKKSQAIILRVSGNRLVLMYDDRLKLMMCMTMDEQ